MFNFAKNVLSNLMGSEENQQNESTSQHQEDQPMIPNFRQHPQQRFAQQSPHFRGPIPIHPQRMPCSPSAMPRMTMNIGSGMRRARPPMIMSERPRMVGPMRGYIQTRPPGNIKFSPFQKSRQEMNVKPVQSKLLESQKLNLQLKCPQSASVPPASGLETRNQLSPSTPDVDLSKFSAEEREIIKSVMAKAQKMEEEPMTAIGQPPNLKKQFQEATNINPMPVDQSQVLYRESTEDRIQPEKEFQQQNVKVYNIPKENEVHSKIDTNRGLMRQMSMNGKILMKSEGMKQNILQALPSEVEDSSKQIKVTKLNAATFDTSIQQRMEDMEAKTSSNTQVEQQFNVLNTTEPTRKTDSLNAPGNYSTSAKNSLHYWNANKSQKLYESIPTKMGDAPCEVSSSSSQTQKLTQSNNLDLQKTESTRDQQCGNYRQATEQQYFGINSSLPNETNIVYRLHPKHVLEQYPDYLLMKDEFPRQLEYSENEYSNTEQQHLGENQQQRKMIATADFPGSFLQHPATYRGNEDSISEMLADFNRVLGLKNAQSMLSDKEKLSPKEVQLNYVVSDPLRNNTIPQNIRPRFQIQPCQFSDKTMQTGVPWISDSQMLNPATNEMNVTQQFRSWEQDSSAQNSPLRDSVNRNEDSYSFGASNVSPEKIAELAQKRVTVCQQVPVLFTQTIPNVSYAHSPIQSKSNFIVSPQSFTYQAPALVLNENESQRMVQSPCGISSYIPSDFSAIEPPFIMTSGLNQMQFISGTPLGTPQSAPVTPSKSLIKEYDSSDTLSETDSQKSLRIRRRLPLLPAEQENRRKEIHKQLHSDRIRQKFGASKQHAKDGSKLQIKHRSAMDTLALARPSSSESNLRKLLQESEFPIVRTESALGILQGSSITDLLGYGEEKSDFLADILQSTSDRPKYKETLRDSLISILPSDLHHLLNDSESSTLPSSSADGRQQNAGPNVGYASKKDEELRIDKHFSNMPPPISIDQKSAKDDTRSEKNNENELRRIREYTDKTKFTSIEAINSFAKSKRKHHRRQLSDTGIHSSLSHGFEGINDNNAPKSFEYESISDRATRNILQTDLKSRHWNKNFSYQNEYTDEKREGMLSPSWRFPVRRFSDDERYGYCTKPSFNDSGMLPRKPNSWHPSPYVSDEDYDHFSREEKKQSIKAEIARRRQHIEENKFLHEELLRRNLGDSSEKRKKIPHTAQTLGKGRRMEIYGSADSIVHDNSFYNNEDFVRSRRRQQLHHRPSSAFHHLSDAELTEEERSINRIASTFQPDDDPESFLENRFSGIYPVANNEFTPHAMPLLPDMPSRSRKLLEDLGSAHENSFPTASEKSKVFQDMNHSKSKKFHYSEDYGAIGGRTRKGLQMMKNDVHGGKRVNVKRVEVRTHPIINPKKKNQKIFDDIM